MTTLMRSFYFSTRSPIMLFGGFLVFLVFSFNNLKAQNTSYNANTVGIGGTNSVALGFQSLLSNTGGSNTSIGNFSLKLNTSGGGNTACGANSLENNNGQANSAFGKNALGLNSSGIFNTANGSSACEYNTIGNENTGSGHAALFTNSTGNANSAFGSYSLGSNVSGSNNTGLGYLANVGSSNLQNATAIGSNSIVTASNSIQLGDANVTQIFGGVGTMSKFISGGLQITGGAPGAGKVLTSDASGNATWQPAGGGGGGTAWDITGNAGTNTGNFIGTTDNTPLSFQVNNTWAGRLDDDGNTFYGLRSGISNAGANENTAIGSFSLVTNTGGIRNTALGTGTLFSADNASNNTAVGYHSLYNNKVAEDNTAVGAEALTANQTGDQNTAVGSGALANNFDGPYNSALGFQALASNTSGQRNTAVGFQSLTANTTGDLNTAMGGLSLLENTTGQNNTAYGYESMRENTSGGNNSAIGFQALYYNTTGVANHAFGQSALFTNTTGTYNVGVGYASLGYNQIGNYNTGLGDLSDVPNFSALDNATAIGARTIVNASNKIRLGDPAVTIIEGTVAFSPSDERFKFDIKEDDVKGLIFINKLRPVVYNFDTRKFQEFLTQTMPEDHRKKYFENRDFRPSTAIRQSGFIAQEVEKAAKEVDYDFNGIHVPESKDDNYSLAYSEFVVPLVKAVQELSRQNDSLKNEIAEIKAMIITGGAGKSTSGSISIAAGEGAKLFQNAPNPFSKTTTIRYTLPDNAKKAMISITNISGVRLKEFDLKSKSAQSIEINGGQLAAGTYIYSLYVDDNLIDSRQMILTR